MPKNQLLFSAVFGFRNPSKEIFSELDEINAQGLIFPQKLPEDRRDHEVGRRGAATLGPRGQGWARAALVCGAPVSPPTPPFRLLKAFVAKPSVPRATIRKTFQRRRRRQSHLRGFRRSPPAPCRRGESSPGGLFIAMIASVVMCE